MILQQYKHFGQNFLKKLWKYVLRYMLFEYSFNRKTFSHQQFSDQICLMKRCAASRFSGQLFRQNKSFHQDILKEVGSYFLGHDVWIVFHERNIYTPMMFDQKCFDWMFWCISRKWLWKQNRTNFLKELWNFGYVMWFSDISKEKCFPINYLRPKYFWWKILA